MTLKGKARQIPSTTTSNLLSTSTSTSSSSAAAAVAPVSSKRKDDDGWVDDSDDAFNTTDNETRSGASNKKPKLVSSGKINKREAAAAAAADEEEEEDDEEEPVKWTKGMMTALFLAYAKYGKKWSLMYKDKRIKKALKSTGSTQTDWAKEVRLQWNFISDMTQFPSDSPVGKMVCEAQKAATKLKEYTPWTEEETEELVRAIEAHGKGNWVQILADPRFQGVRGRTNVQVLPQLVFSFHTYLLHYRPCADQGQAPHPLGGLVCARPGRSRQTQRGLGKGSGGGWAKEAGWKSVRLEARHKASFFQL